MDMIVRMRWPVHWSVNLTFLAENAGVRKVGYYTNSKGYIVRDSYVVVSLDQARRILKKVAHDADWTDLDMIDIWMKNVCENSRLKEMWKEIRA